MPTMFEYILAPFNLPALVWRMLGSTELDDQIDSAETLGHSGNSLAVEPLFDLLDGEDHAAVKAAAVAALGKIADPRAVRPLVTRFLTPGSKPLPAVGDALAAIGKQHPHAIISLLNQPIEGGRIVVLNILAKAGTRATLDAITTYLRDPDTEIRWEATRLLADKGDPRATPFLLTRLRSAEPIERMVAADLLGKVNPVRHLSALREALEDAEPNVRVAAARAVWGIPDGSVIGETISKLEGEALSSFLRERPATALEALAATGEIGVKTLLGLVTAGGTDRAFALGELTHLTLHASQSREKALAMSDRLNETVLTEQVVPLLRDPDLEVRRGAASLLTALDWEPGEQRGWLEIAKGNYASLMESPGGPQLLLEWLEKNPDRGDRATLARLLVSRGQMRAVPALLRDHDGDESILNVLERAVEQAGRLFDEEGLEAVAGMADIAGQTARINRLRDLARQELKRRKAPSGPFVPPVPVAPAAPAAPATLIMPAQPPTHEPGPPAEAEAPANPTPAEAPAPQSALMGQFDEVLCACVCGNRYRIPPRMLGSVVRCQQCGVYGLTRPVD